jgi:hypothetical protein
MVMQYLTPLVLIGAFGAYYVWMQKKTNARMQAMPAAYRMFFERTGYRLPNLPPTAPIEAHVAQAITDAGSFVPGNSKTTEYVRDFSGTQIRHRSMFRSGERPGSYSISVSWSAAHRAPPRLQFEVVEKSMVGARRVVGEMFSNMTSDWAPSFPAFQSGDPEIDNRFALFANNPQHAQAVVRDPLIRERLLGLAHVCLCAHSHEVFLSDPMQKNLIAGMGGIVGQMATGLDAIKSMELSIPVHERIAELLAATQRMAQ